MDTNRKHTKMYRFPKISLDDLRDFGSRVVYKNKDDIKKDCGKILSILNTKVDTMVVRNLIQFYDAPLRCFTFQDY